MNPICASYVLVVLVASCHGYPSKILPTWQQERIANVIEEVSNSSPGPALNPEDYLTGETLEQAAQSPPVDDNAQDPIEIAGLFEGDIAQLPENITEEDRNGILDLRRRWNSGVIPYVISNEYGQYERAQIARAMDEYARKTCIRFTPRSNERDFINIFKGSGCYSLVGKSGGQQPVSLGNGCVWVGIAIHEFMHAAGFWHEQSRPDRDEYVIIYWDNIIDSQKHNFQKFNWNQVQHLGVGYDTGSVMHYGSNAFAKDRRYPAIVARRPGVQLGQRRGFSTADLTKLNRLYQCSNDATQTSQHPTSPQVGCMDSDSECPSWAENGLCETNSAMMSLTCPRSCKQCDKPLCKDLEERCGNWSLAGQCTKNPDYMLRYCTKSCGGCGRYNPVKPQLPSEGSAGACATGHAMCIEWKGKNQCAANPSFMGRYCKKECGFCQ